jgi:hypothetical protein
MALALVRSEGKRCNRCGVDRPDTVEHYRLYNKGGSSPWQQKRKAICRVCESIAAVAWTKAHPEKYKGMQKKNYQRHKPARRAYSRKKLFGITPDQFTAMLEAQGYACAICRDKKQLFGPVGGADSFHVDHCHRTKKVRGLLCSKCNQAIGLLREDIEIISAAKAYLERNRNE